MAFGITHYFPGGTKAQYEASITAVHGGLDKLPSGQIYHSAGPSAGGWLIVAVHNTRESWESFRDGILMPAFRKGIPGGFTVPPEERSFEVDHQLP